MLRKIIDIFRNSDKEISKQKSESSNPAIREYITSEDIEKAEKLGIPLNEYQNRRHGFSPKKAVQFDHFSLPFIKDKDVILEIGPGTGYLAHHLLGIYKNIKIYFFEPSDPLCGYLKKYLSKYDMRIHFMPSNGTGWLLGIEDESMDVIMGFGVFVYVYHRYTFRYFREVAAKLKKGGFFMFNFHNMDNASDEFIKEMDTFLISNSREMLSLDYIKRFFRIYNMEVISEKFVPHHSTYVTFKKV